VIRAVQQTAEHGLSFGAPTEMETVVARRIIELVPSIELVRMVSSGTEATMSAIRLAARLHEAQQDHQVRGCYHGHSDSLLVKAGSGMLTSACRPRLACRRNSRVYGDPAVQRRSPVRAAFAEIGADVACVIVEPVAGNMNCIRPCPVSSRPCARSARSTGPS